MTSSASNHVTLVVGLNSVGCKGILSIIIVEVDFIY